MKRLTHGVLAKLILGSLLITPLFAGGIQDSFGYYATTTGDPDATPYAFHDISGTSSPLTLTNADDGKANNITLQTPFPFYDSIYSEVVMATNGYLSFDPSDRGGDFTNDSSLPRAPSSGGGPRIYPLHNDLVADAPGTLHYQYFPEGLRSFPLLPKIGVHVFQWHQVRHLGDTARFSFQALLYDDGTIHFVYPPGNPELGSGSTTGIQSDEDVSPFIGLLIAADSAGSIPASSTATIHPPHFVVSSSSDSASEMGSLRNIISNAPSPAHITFDATVFNSESNRTITLAQGHNISNKALTLDASGVCGLTLDADSMSRHFSATSSTLILNSLNLTGGNNGAISANGSDLFLTNCALYENVGGGGGGAIFNQGNLILDHVTIAHNTINSGSLGTPGIVLESGTLTLANTVLYHPDSPIVDGDLGGAGGTIVTRGHNFISNHTSQYSSSFPLSSPPSEPNTNGDFAGNNTSPLDPLFLTSASGQAFGDTGFLTNHGGPTLTLMPLPGSPLIDQAQPTIRPGLDQRGVLTIGRRDIGAVETNWDQFLTIDSIPARDITSPSDLITIYPEGHNAFPDNPVSFAIDGRTAEFATNRPVNTGFTITPGIGASRLTGLSFQSGPSMNDLGAAPASFLLLGSHDLSHFTPLASSDIPPFTSPSQALTIFFTNHLPSYRHYRLIFPTIANSNKGFISIGEIELLGSSTTPPQVTDFAVTIVDENQDGTINGGSDSTSILIEAAPLRLDRQYLVLSGSSLDDLQEDELFSFNELVGSDGGRFSQLRVLPTNNGAAIPPKQFFRLQEKLRWQIETVDSEGRVGSDSSLAFSPAGLPAISYRDSTNADLKFAELAPVIPPLSD